MKLWRLIAVLGVAALLVGTLTYFDLEDDAQQIALNIAPYGKVEVTRFRGGSRNLIISFSDSQGWRKELQDEAWGQAWPDRIVAGVDLPQFRKAMTGGCADYAGAVKRINDEVARVLKIVPDDKPFLVGRGDGGAVAFAAAAQSKSHKIQGVVASDFCPLLTEAQPPCALQVEKQGDGFRIEASDALETPFVAVADPGVCKTTDLAGFIDKLPDAHIVTPQTGQMTDLMAAVVTQTNERTSTDPTVTVAALEDLPIIEVPSALKNNDDRLAIIMTGDGGWADIDRTIGEELAKQGVATVGFNTLKYFWEAQTPEDTAADLDRIIRHYMNEWHRTRVVLVGFSFGADILPFVMPRLSHDVRDKTALIALLSPGRQASYEISVGGWVGVDATDGPEVAPAVNALSAPVLCVQSIQETERPCEGLNKPNIESVVMEGDHHFDGNYAPLVARILEKSKK